MTPAQSYLEYACAQLVAAVRCTVVCGVPADVVAQRIVAVAKECGRALDAKEGGDAGSR